jgi:predicted metal-dependent hydrolase
MLESALVKVPMVAGILKPVILLPAGLISGLPMEQIEMILIHELVHIRRRDYLVNIIQSIMEVLFFYHPALWWISRHLRREREHLCDDMTLAVTGDSITYARTLASLREMELYAPALAATMAQNKHQLLDRIRRITGMKGFKSVPSGGWLPAMVILVAVMTFLLGMVISDKTDAREIRTIDLNMNSGTVPASRVFTGLLPDADHGLSHPINAKDPSGQRIDPCVGSGDKDIITSWPDTASRKQADTSSIRDQKKVYNDMQTLSKALQQLSEELSSMQQDFRRLQKQIQEQSAGAYGGSQGEYLEQEKKAMEQYKEAMGQYRKQMKEKQKEIQERFRDDSLRKHLERLYYNFSDSCKPGVYFFGLPGTECFPLPNLGDQFRVPGNYYYYYKKDTTFNDSLGKEQYEKYLRLYSSFDSLKVDTSIAHAFKQWHWDWKPPKGAFIYPGVPDSINAALEEFYKQLPQILDDKDLNELLIEPPDLYDFHFDTPPDLPDESYLYVNPEPDDRGCLKGYRHIDNYYDFQKVKQIIREELLDDGLISPEKSYIISIDAKEMLINGVKQPKNVYTKYRRLLESAIGEDLTEGVTYYF